MLRCARPARRPDRFTRTMSEPDKPSGDRIVRDPPRAAAHGANPLAWLLALVLLAGAGYAAWRGWLWTADTLNVVSTQQELLARLGREVQTLRAQADELASRQTDLAQAVQRNGTDVASIIGRVEDSNEAIARLNETVEGGRTRVQLAAVEQLLLMANDRMQLAGDASSALRALDLADQRLARLNDPRLQPVREALSQERSALTALVLPDTTGFALALGDIQKRAATLPLRVHAPRPDEAPGPSAPEQPAEGSWASRIAANVKAALTGLF